METELCKKCGSELKVLDNRRRGIIYMVMAIPTFAIAFALASGTFIPYIPLVYFLVIGLSLILKDDRFVYVCTKCNFKAPKGTV